ncbi:protein crumbs isoform X1 [Frankliniella occidentalis]|uniref:Protein crumbs isoform X1 n=1 Tax=Frankliniella occidentalis TaxID=133901 RepID=A0A9C6X1F4_FRAOC|nr:protein crumbs isoform X1 [Frankliniella occidentalis]
MLLGVLALCLAPLCAEGASTGSSRQQEGYFDGAAYVQLLSPVSLRGHVGLSFRTCEGGQLFHQTSSARTSTSSAPSSPGSPASSRSVSLDVREEGLVLRVTVGAKQFESRFNARLLDNEWHNVNLVYLGGNLTLTVASHSQVVANSTYNSEILSDLEPSSYDSVLRVGEGFVGCILQGPSLVFNTSAMLSKKVQWGGCPLNNFSCSKVDHCINEPCLRHGVCFSLPDRYDCRCSARYTGKNCEVDNGSPCNRNGVNPCQNNGHCMEDQMGNYKCHCGPSHTGQHCETEITSHICENNPCQNNGSCRVSAGNRYECTCLPGFTGVNCEININECQSNPCQHGGSCIDGINNYTCICSRTGYVGLNCDVNINECDLNPCLNQGLCFDNYGSYTCQCMPGFAGQNCEQNINECSSSPCLNNAHCIDVVGSYECHCQHGFTGRNCETDINECETAVCPSNSQCVDGIGSFQCVCKDGLTGKPPNCSEVNVCTSSPCVNGGTCVVVGDHFNCTCPNGFIGKMCQVNIDECASNPCLNGGTCLDQIGGYICNCSDEFMGVHCEMEFDACAFKPCKNGGECVTQPRRKEFYCECAPGFSGLECKTDIDDCANVTCPVGRECVDLVNDYECRCPPGYSGDNCTLDVDYCASSPCKNNGTCQNAAGSFVCDCPAGYQGRRCEQDVDECKLADGLCNQGICVNKFGGYDCFCRPGFTGTHCELDFDECLSRPCQNNATCENLINSFNCVCTPGYTGRECNIDINECDSNPCQNNSTCIDGIATFSCICPPGLTGILCETNIDDCESSPCWNNGLCIDGINSFTCDCSDTGFSGERCENNIDDCLGDPCTNGAECVDGIKDYTCECYAGYSGKNCEIDINECESSPCQYGGFCFQKSNSSLYQTNDPSLPAIFAEKFSYENASGYICLCVPGITGSNCEVNINECESNPCRWGNCVDKIGHYDCECEEGFMGAHCEIDIDECDLYKPCVNGTCIDRRANYFCECTPKYGGKNCSVELHGCDENRCQNNGTCKPYLENETQHKFNCSCTNGYHGDLCEKVTTMSLSGKSYALVHTTRDEGYDIQFRFKTTLPDGLLAIGKGSTFYILELVHGRLNLHSSLLNKWEGVFIGSGLNDSTWQKVFVAINASHLVLAANEEQTIYPINLNEGSGASHTSFPTTYLGGTISSLRRLTHGPPSFVGCVEDVVINGNWVLPENPSQPVVLENIAMGCPREPQCSPNPCHNGGHCTDLWSDFSCACERPFLGHTCQYNFTAATFGYENITNGLVTVNVHDQARRAVRSIVDISMFIRTRQSKGVIFQLGSAPTVEHQDQTQISAQLDGGELFVGIQFNGTPEGYTVGGVRLDDGSNHLIQVVRNVTLVQVKINGTEYFRKTISASGQLDVQVLYLGGVPPNARVNFRPGGSPDHSNFKGIIQDVQISNGSRTMVTEFFPLKADDLTVPPSFGTVMFANDTVLEGVISDDTCSSNPCLHNGTCKITWNDFSCECVRGYKGKTCQEMEFCQLQDCPMGSTCRNLNDGYECIANATFNGVNSSMSYSLGSLETSSSESPLATSYNSIAITYRSHNGGTLMHIASVDGDDFFSIAALKSSVTVAWKLGPGHGRARRLRKEHSSGYGDWTALKIDIKDGALHAHIQQDEWSEEAQSQGTYQFSEPDFAVEAWYQLVATGRVILGAGPPISVASSSSLGEDEATVSTRHSYVVYDHDSSDAPTGTTALDDNAVDFPAIGKIPGESSANGGYFKGCLGEVRIGGLLLPFFTQDQLNMENMTALEFFYLLKSANETNVITDLGCILCFEQECQNGGSCLNPKESYTCSCPLGFEQDDCSVNTDECIDNSCQNNATCVDAIANYTCSCQPGWEGWLCDIDINECESNPCTNNGSCQNLLGRFECLCTSEYEGSQCQFLKMVSCDNGPCKNGSTCRDEKNLRTGDNFTCSCAEGFVGPYCDQPFCDIEHCQQGFCDTSQLKPFCNCSPGFTGRLCGEDINECEVGPERTTPCMNRGLCRDGINSFSCDCRSTGFTGPKCEDDIDECALNPQLCGSGTCENLIGTYRCECTEGFCGDSCRLQNPCLLEDNPCQFDGKCTEDCHSEPDYRCDCTDGHSGKNCTETPYYAASNPFDVAIIVAPIIGAILLLAAGGLIVFIMMARKKRATRGTYSPSQQEYCNPRVEMDNVMKPPPEERLI